MNPENHVTKNDRIFDSLLAFYLRPCYFAIAVFGRLDSSSFSIATNLASTAIGAAGGIAVQSFGGKDSTKRREPDTQEVGDR
ncbi:MAG: hypothetical protein HC786_23875 [Richelia sp. CSU_2_1]|nr:hypothetical protein [Richelia sp. CSU_2_1]